MKTIKISELPLYQSLKGLFTIGTDSNNRSVKVPLEDLGGGGGGAEYDNRDQITEIAPSTSATQVKITVTQKGGNTKEVTLPAANSTNAGVMTKTQFNDLATAVNKVVNALSGAVSNGDIKLTVTYADNTTKEVTLPIATATNLKANKVANADILSPNEWPKTIIRNIETETFDYSSINVGDIYLDGATKAPYYRLYYKYHLDAAPADLGAPQTKVAYYCEATKKHYEWIPNAAKTSGEFRVLNDDGGGGGSAELPSTIIETEEDGFFLIDENLNIGGYATAEGSNIITTSIIGESL